MQLDEAVQLPIHVLPPSLVALSTSSITLATQVHKGDRLLPHDHSASEPPFVILGTDCLGT